MSCLDGTTQVGGTRPHVSGAGSLCIDVSFNVYCQECSIREQCAR
jgi:hypothetical protein